MRMLVLALVACGAPPPTKPVAPVTPTKPPAAVTPVAACATPEHRQFDFWVGDWDVSVHARASPTSDEWAVAKGRQRIEAILGGCAISESFTAEGPKQPWAGRSFSSWQATLGKWRQTWVDDSGSFLAFTGGIEDGEMRLYGEPRTVKEASFQMRMVFKNISAESLRWEWQRSTDSWATSTVMMTVDYARRR
jgi:hypothetical protein